MNSEFYSYIMEKAFENGALDVFMTPIIMKKNRPGITLSILCKEVDIKTLEKILFLETTTLGIRKYSVDRSTLEREVIDIETKYGSIPIKIGVLEGKKLKSAPEYEECRRIAKIYDVPIKDVYEEAVYVSRELLSK